MISEEKAADLMSGNGRERDEREGMSVMSGNRGVKISWGSKTSQPGCLILHFAHP